MITKLPPHCTLFCETINGWKMIRGDQLMTRVKNMGDVTRRLACVGGVRLPGWSPWDPPDQWLGTICDMAEFRSHWRFYFWVLSSSVLLFNILCRRRCSISPHSFSVLPWVVVRQQSRPEHAGARLSVVLTELTQTRTVRWLRSAHHHCPLGVLKLRLIGLCPLLLGLTFFSLVFICDLVSALLFNPRTG